MATKQMNGRRIEGSILGQKKILYLGQDYSLLRGKIASSCGRFGLEKRCEFHIPKIKICNQQIYALILQFT